jgi:hypothetical protein
MQQKIAADGWDVTTYATLHCEFDVRTRPRGGRMGSETRKILDAIPESKVAGWTAPGGNGDAERIDVVWKGR